MAATRALRDYEIHDHVAAVIEPRRELKLFVKNVQTPGTFAWGASILAPTPSLTVQGLGEITLPLSKESVGVLRGAAELAPFGYGAETKVDESVRQAWQIDAKQIGLSAEFAEAIGKQHALKAAKKLGLRAKALGVEARLYKLVMYENGGHFRPHKDTEKEVGMFGTLVVQLPTAQGHKGGALIVRHRSKQKVFAWEDPDGSYARRQSGIGAGALPPLPVRCAAFYGDCEHELQPVTAGVRLCLLFNLVRTTLGALPAATAVKSRSESLLRFSRAMAAWGRPGSGCHAAKFILPLEHVYTKASLSFDGLKERDRAMADALRACRQINLYLATVVKHESGTAEEDYHDRWRRDHGFKRRKSSFWDVYGDEDDDEEEEDEDEDGYGSDSDAEGKVMEYVNQTSVEMEDLMGADDDSMDLGIGRCVEDHEILGCHSQDFGEQEGLDLLFPDGTEPDEREYEGYTGNCSPTLDFWYHRAVLILWPASATMRVALHAYADTALSVARKRSARYGAAGALPLADLAWIVSLAEKGVGQKPEDRFSYYRRPFTDGRDFTAEARLTVDVLGLCASAGVSGLPSSRRFLRVLAGKAPAGATTATVERAPGLRSGEVARAVAALVRVVGWPAVGEDMTRLLKACNLDQAGHVSVLVDELSSLPLPRQQPDLEHDVGIEVEVNAEQQQQQQQQHQQQLGGVVVKTEVQAEHKQQQLEPPQCGAGVKEEIQRGQKQGTSDSVGLTPSEPSPSTPASSPRPASQRQPGAVVKAEAQAGQAAPVAEVGPCSSVGALIVGTYVYGITSNPDALARIGTNALAAIVCELLLDRRCFANSSSLNRGRGANPLLTFFAGVGGTRLQTKTLAAAVHHFRTQLGGRSVTASASPASAPASARACSLPPPHHCSAVVTLATGLVTRGFQDLEASEVKTFAEDLLWLSDVLWLAARAQGAGGLEQWFTGAVLTSVRSGDPSQADKGQKQLKAVLASKAVQATVREGRGGTEPVLWKALVLERLRKLEAHTPPVLCWRQPDAAFGGSPHIQQFLRGPASTLAYRGEDNVPFGRIAEARAFISRAPFGRIKAKAVARGSGRGAYVEITKTKEDYEKRVREYAEVKSEVAVLRALSGSNSYSQVARSGVASVGGGGGATAAAGGSGAGSIGRPLSTVSGNVGASRVAAAGARKGCVGRRAGAEVVDLCDSP